MKVVQRTKGVDSARRALQILLQFTQDKPELVVDDLLELHDISLPSAYRYLALLREMYLIEERSKGVFVLSPEILQLAQAAERTLDYRTEAQSVLDTLCAETDETALYLRRLNDAVVCQAISNSDHAVSISFQPGHVMPLHAGAAAKLLFAEYSKSRRARYLNGLEPPLDPVGRARLEADLDRIKKERYSVSEAEVDEGVWACAAPVRVHGRLIGAITVVAPLYRLVGDQQERIGEAVRRAARELERLVAQPH